MLKNGAATKPSRPATITAPKMTGRASDLSSVEATIAVMGGDAREGDAVDEGQPGADLPDAEGLQEGGEARGEQAGAGEEGEVGAGQADGRADDQGWGDDSRVHGGHMLEAGGGHLQRGEFLVYGVGGHGGSSGRLTRRRGRGFQGGGAGVVVRDRDGGWRGEREGCAGCGRVTASERGGCGR
ncbi:hypothetical protein GCM10020256_13030 [Streptomyces thermocoprophilus]